MTSIEPTTKTGERMVVAMSGGVDSSAAALMLHEQGKNGGSASRATCCAPSDFDDAREIADSCGFPYYVFDFEDSFYESVISPFVKSYLNGLTPNPGLDCNRKVKFHQLRARAAALGAETVATGHFAQIRVKPDGLRGLYTARDGNKDQTYFLYTMTQHDLERTVFPVGGMTKPEVRTYLAQQGFTVSSKPESQDICFVASSVSEFIDAEAGPQPGGEIVSTDGKILGSHHGVHRYTVGQRKGLGVSSEHPLYVLNIDPNENRVTVGGREELQRDSFEVAEVNWIAGTAITEPIVANVKVRYRTPAITCRLEPTECGDRIKVFFMDEWTAVSPGQAAVIYRSESEEDGAVEVLGGGIIVKGNYAEAE